MRRLCTKKQMNTVINQFEPGKLVLIAARPGMGKTTFLMYLGKRLSENKKVLLISLEYNASLLTERYGKSNIIINDDTDTSVEKIRDITQNQNINVVLIDYIQLFPASDTNPIEQLKTLAESLNINVIVTSQLRRDLKKRPPKERRPTLEDLQSTLHLKPLEYSSQIIFLYREDY